MSKPSFTNKFKTFEEANEFWLNNPDVEVPDFRGDPRRANWITQEYDIRKDTQYWYLRHISFIEGYENAISYHGNELLDHKRPGSGY